jgi:hypothetical protein
VDSSSEKRFATAAFIFKVKQNNIRTFLIAPLPPALDNERKW